MCKQCPQNMLKSDKGLKVFWQWWLWEGCPLTRRSIGSIPGCNEESLSKTLGPTLTEWWVCKWWNVTCTVKLSGWPIRLLYKYSPFTYRPNLKFAFPICFFFFFFTFVRTAVCGSKGSHYKKVHFSIMTVSIFSRLKANWALIPSLQTLYIQMSLCGGVLHLITFSSTFDVSVRCLV